LKCPSAGDKIKRAAYIHLHRKQLVKDKGGNGNGVALFIKQADENTTILREHRGYLTKKNLK